MVWTNRRDLYSTVASLSPTGHSSTRTTSFLPLQEPTQSKFKAIEKAQSVVHVGIMCWVSCTIPLAHLRLPCPSHPHSQVLLTMLINTAAVAARKPNKTARSRLHVTALSRTTQSTRYPARSTAQKMSMVGLLDTTNTQSFYITVNEDSAQHIEEFVVGTGLNNAYVDIPRSDLHAPSTVSATGDVTKPLHGRLGLNWTDILKVSPIITYLLLTT